MRKLALLFLALSGCASQSEEISGNEIYLRKSPDKHWDLHCWNLRGNREAKPFVILTVHGDRRVANLRFPGAREDYLDHELPFENERYGPFLGEEIMEWTSPYKTGSDFKVTEGFHLILPVLDRGIAAISFGHDRDSLRKNGFVEIRPRNQGIRTSVDLHCEAD